VAARHQGVRQQHARLLRAVQRHHPCVVYELRACSHFERPGYAPHLSSPTHGN
jgi:hypothetical protein